MMFALCAPPIDVRAVREAVSDPALGAILVYEGDARNHFEGRAVTELSYEAWPEMAVPAMEQIGNEIARKWPGARCAIVHRTGVVPVTEASVVIVVGTPHRAECYAASRHAIEALKERVPIWKKEIYADGAAWKANTPSQ